MQLHHIPLLATAIRDLRAKNCSLKKVLSHFHAPFTFVLIVSLATSILVPLSLYLSLSLSSWKLSVFVGIVRPVFSTMKLGIPILFRSKIDLFRTSKKVIRTDEDRRKRNL